MLSLHQHRKFLSVHAKYVVPLEPVSPKFFARGPDILRNRTVSGYVTLIHKFSQNFANISFFYY